VISFNKSPVTANSIKYIQDALVRKTGGDGSYTKKCTEWLREKCGASHTLLTTSCSHALDMAAHLCEIEPGDEVIMPSFTFSSTANAFVGCGAKIVFVDIRPDTMNINENLIEDAITDRTRVIVPMHYAGVACEMDCIMDIAQKYKLKVVEDAAHAIVSEYNGKPLGSFGEFGCLSFHDTKNFSMGEGGALLIRDPEWIARAEIMREKGTDRSRFFRGEIDKYSWVDWGSSYVPSDINAAYLWSQLEIADEMTGKRLSNWRLYYKALSPLADRGVIQLPYVPKGCVHNGHLFYIKVADYNEQIRLIRFLKEHNVYSVFHYVPLHSSKAGQLFSRFHGEDVYTTRESRRIVRLPMWNGLTEENIGLVVDMVYDYYM